MPPSSPVRERRSRWSHVASALFGLATLAFVLLWHSRSNSSIEALFSQGAAVVSFALLWGLGALALACAVFRAWRKRWTPRVPLLPVVLAVVALASCGWLAFGRATPERLVTSAARGDVAWVERCLRWGVDVDARYRQLLGFGGSHPSATALGAAASAGRLQVVDVLIEAGADLEQTDTAGWTPCIAAVVAGHVDVVARLLEAGALVAPDSPGSASSPTSRSALSMALLAHEDRRAYPLESMLRLLIQSGAEPNRLALHRQALWSSQPAAAGTFAVLSQRSPAPAAEGAIALLRALASGDEDATLRLHTALRAAEPTAVGEEQRLTDEELLVLGAKLGRTAFVEHLLDRGLPVDGVYARTRDPLTALHYAVVHGRTATVGLLVERGADIEQRDGSFGTALHRACAAGHADVVDLLIRAGAELEAPRSETFPDSPLFSCVAPQALDCARLLLEAGADVDARDGRGQVAADRAQAHGQTALADLLRTWGAD